MGGARKPPGPINQPIYDLCWGKVRSTPSIDFDWSLTKLCVNNGLGQNNIPSITNIPGSVLLIFKVNLVELKIPVWIFAKASEGSDRDWSKFTLY